MAYQITTHPSHEPVTLAEAKLHLRVDTDLAADDVLITNLIRAARGWCEGYQNRSWLRRTITAKYTDWSDKMVVPAPPLISVSSITYVDTAGTTQTLGTSVYTVDTTSDPGRILLAYNQTWPSLRGDEDGITITYLAGYVAAFTAAADTDYLTVNAAAYAVGDRVRVYTTDTLPPGLAVDTDYYVVSVAGNKIKLSATPGGTNIDITGAGTGTHTIDAVPLLYRQGLLARVAEMYYQRGDGESQDNRMLRDLLGPGRMVSV